MDENKNTVNNDTTQTKDNMNYSFDFANQVDNSVKVATPEVTNNSVSEQPVTSEVPTQSADVAPATADNSVNQTVNAETNQTTTSEVPAQSADVAPATADNSVNQTVNVETNQPTTSEVSTQPADVAPATTPEVNTENSTAPSDTAQADANPVIPGAIPNIPVTPETVAAKQDDAESLELIKDKKATKKFLIMLFVLILAFIIALPFIFNILG